MAENDQPSTGNTGTAPANPSTPGPLNMMPADNDPVLQMLRLGLSWDSEDGHGGSAWVSYPNGLRCDVPATEDYVTFTDMDTHLIQQVLKAGLPQVTKVITYRSLRNEQEAGAQ